MYKTWIIKDLNGELYQVTTETASQAEAEQAFLTPGIGGQYPVINSIELLPDMYPTSVRKLFQS